MRSVIPKNENIKVVCSGCGGLIPQGSKFCNYCGAPLTGNEKLVEIGPAPVSAKNKKNAIHSASNNRPSPNGKQISLTKVIYLVIALVAVGLIVMYAAGIFDSASSKVSAEGNADQGGGKLASIQAINDQEALVKNTPGNMENLLTLAHLYNDGGFYQKAIDKYNIYLQTNPKVADVIVDMGVCYFNLGQHQKAIDNFKKGIEINPNHQIAHLNMGVVYNFGMNNKTEALKWWKKAVELNPSSDIGKRAQEFLNQNK